MSDNIPHDSLLEILLRLPVKPLLKCRCVSKTWHSIISDPTFITTHLNRTLSKTTHNNPNTVLFRTQKFKSKEKENFALHIDDTDETFASHSTQLDCPHRSNNFFLSIVGYCNGVLCLADDYIGYRGDGYVIWNPSIHKSVSIPGPNVCFMSHGPFMHSLGFGFDAVNNDYKLVRLVYLEGEDCLFEVMPPLVEIYSLKSGSWRDVIAPAPNYVIKERSLQAFVNGACHWAAHTPRKKGKFRNVILSFDLENEIFSEIDVPESLVGENSLNMAVTVLGGSLALVSVLGGSLALVSFQWGQGRCSVWVMKKYGFAESWTELFGIGIRSMDDSGGLRVVALRKNGEVLVVTSGGEKVFSFDPKNQKFRKFFGTRGHPRSVFLDTYVESLVLLNEANSDEGNAELQEQEQASSTSNAGKSKKKEEEEEWGSWMKGKILI